MDNFLRKDLLIKRFYDTHPNCDCDLDFTNFNYIGCNVKSDVFCNKKDKYGIVHGNFPITPSNLIAQKNVCPKCYREMCAKRQTLETKKFIEKLKKIYGDTLDYSFVDYKHNKIPVLLYCNELDENGVPHGFFEAKPCNLTRGIRGCDKCKEKKKREKALKYFERLKEKFKDKPYDFSYAIFINASTKIKVFCNEIDIYGNPHGFFDMIPSQAMSSNYGCPKCAGNYHKTTEDFIRDAIRIHGDKYDYSKVVYINQETPVCIICPIHGEFWMTPNKHLSSKQGCPYCKESKLEKEISVFLKEKGVKFKRFVNKKDFKWLNLQSLDFYLPEYNVAIECQGIQHFNYVKHFNSITFDHRKELDELKFNKCLDHGIKMYYFTHCKIPKEFAEKHTYYKNKEKLLDAVIKEIEDIII